MRGYILVLLFLGIAPILPVIVLGKSADISTTIGFLLIALAIMGYIREKRS